MRSNSVVLPAPFGPTMPTISPRCSWIDTSSTAVIPENRRVMPRVSSTRSRSPPFTLTTRRTHRRRRPAERAPGSFLRLRRPRRLVGGRGALEEDRAQQVGAFEQLGREPVEADRALLHEEGLVGDGERDVHRLLDEDDRDALFLELLDDGEELLDDERCETERQLVDHQHVGLGEEGHRDREHLLLTARQLRRRIAAADSRAPGRG